MLKLKVFLSAAHFSSFFRTMVLVFSFLMFAGPSLNQSNLPASEVAPARWTLAFYLAGENSLERYQADNFREIVEGAAALSDVHVVVFFDRDEDIKRETPWTSWKGTRVFHVRGGSYAETFRQPLAITLPASIEAERFHELVQERIDDSAERRFVQDAYWRQGSRFVLKSLNEGQKTRLLEILKNTDYLLPLGGTKTVNLEATAESTMRQFFSFVRDNFPAEHYGLFITGHGSGWYEKDVLPSGGRKHPSPEYYQTLKSSALGAAVGRQPFDVLVLDSCLMADMETLWNLKDSAEYLILSQIEIPAWGLNYTVLLKDIAKKSLLTPLQLTRATIAAYESTYKGARYPIAVTAFETTHIKTFGHQWQAFCARPGNRTWLLKAASTAMHVPSSTPTRQAMVDLVQFTRDLNAPWLANRLNQMMVASYRQYTAGQGISIYLPANNRILDHTLELYKETPWAREFPDGWINVVPDIVSSGESSRHGLKFDPPAP